jgi:site-specific DNA recombinase
MVAGYGATVAGFLDSGQSRTLPWARRPQAAALVRSWPTLTAGGMRS